MKDFLKVVSIGFIIYFFSWFIVFRLGINDLAIQSEDTLPALYLPAAILEDQTLFLDKYYPEMLKNYPHPDDKDYKKAMVPFYLKEVRSFAISNSQMPPATHYVSAFPIVTPILAMPIYLGAHLLSIPINLQNVTYLGHIAAALLMAITSGFFFVLVKKYFELPTDKSWLLAIVFMFGTINYALVSQALWQHGAVELFTILSLIFIFEKKWFLFGLSAGLMVLSRPTAALVLPFLGFYCFYTWTKSINLQQQIKNALLIGLGFLIPTVFFFWYTNKFYFGIQNNGYASQFLTEWQSRFPEGFLGLWLAPNKGILMYSPIFIFAIIGWWISRKSFQYQMFGAVVLLHTLVLGKWKHWYGGWSFGYRMAADIIPFLVLLLIPFIRSKYFEKYKKIYYFLFIFSILVQVFGIVFFDGIWHAAYDRGFVDTGWLWSLKDSELAFNIRRILVKFGYLDKACPTCLPN